MSTLKTPFRYDFVGSFLRPQILKDSKKKLKNGEIQKDEYDKIVNEEITKLVAKQKKTWFPRNHRRRVQKNFLAP